MKKFWKWSKNEVFTDNSELILDGVIASESWWGDEVTPKLFRDELAQNKGNVTVRINSPGGDVYAGLHIYNALKDHDGQVTVYVDSLAASAASIIAMAGDKIIMTPGSMMMIHKPWIMAIGNSEDLKEAAAYLEKVGSGIVPIYTNRTGISAEEITKMLDEETWMTAGEAVELGFADEAEEAKSKTSDAVKNVLNSFAPVKDAVMQPVMNLQAKIEAKNSLDKPKEEAKKNVTNKAKEPKEDIKSKKENHHMNEDPKENEVQPTEPQDSKVNNKAPEEEKVNKETPKNSDKEIAKDQVLAIDDKPKIEVGPSASYIKSPKALEDYADILRQNAGKTGQEVKDAWSKHLETKMGITNPDVLLPPAIIQAIEDAFEKGGEIWNLLNKTGLDVYATARDTVTGEDSRAKGYNRDEEDEKAEEVITLAARTLRPQFIYKYLTLPKEVVKENRSSGALLRYVLSELPNRIIREVERAVVTGDGRTPGTALKINEGTPNGFFPIKADASGGIFAHQYTPASVNETHYESILRAKALVKAEGGKYLIAKTGYMVDLMVQQSVNGGFLFAPGTDFVRALGLAGIIEPDWMDEDTDNDAYIFVPSQYRTVGDNSIESFTNFQLKTNLNEYLQEIWAGGGLTALNAAVAITAEES